MKKPKKGCFFKTLSQYIQNLQEIMGKKKKRGKKYNLKSYRNDGKQIYLSSFLSKFE
jgi:hypothetical protein